MIEEWGDARRMTRERIASLFGGISTLLLYLALGVWFAGTGYMASWARTRPLKPESATGRIYEFWVHGRLYVSATDLRWWHLTEIITPCLFLSGVVCGSIARRLVGKTKTL